MNRSVKLTDNNITLVAGNILLSYSCIVKLSLGFEPGFPAWEEDDLLTELFLPLHEKWNIRPIYKVSIVTLNSDTLLWHFKNY